MVKFLTSTLYLSSEGNFISFFVGCPRIFSYPQTGYWAWPFFYAVCTYKTRYWAWPPPMQFEYRVQLAPTIALQNLAFRLVGRKGGFWFSRRICLMIWFYWVKSQQHVFIFLWLVPDSSVSRMRLHLILATPLSPTFNGWMIIQRRLSFLGIWAGEFPLLIFAQL